MGAGLPTAAAMATLRLRIRGGVCLRKSIGFMQEMKLRDKSLTCVVLCVTALLHLGLYVRGVPA